MQTRPLIHVQRIERPEWHPACAIGKEIAELVAPSYVDATAILEREMDHCDLLYHVRGEDGRLVNFFMIARESVQIDGCATPTIFLGLSATSQATKGSGLVWDTYKAFITEACGWERLLSCPLLLRATTATPSAYHALNRLFDDVEPRPDGSYTPEGARIANSLRTLYGLAPVGAHENPFVLRGVASRTRYSPEEEVRIAEICRRNEFDLFDKVGVDERQGDRLLLICRLRKTANRAAQ